MFFSKKDKSKTANVANVAITSIIGNDMTIVGNVSFKGKARLDGKIEGNIDGEHLILSDSAGIKGDIDAETVVCQGQVDGDVKANDLSVKSGGIINGKVETTNLLVESGASLNGEIKSRTKDLRLVHGRPPSSKAVQEQQQEQSG